MAGLLAANMLRSRSPIVVEKSASLPNNHRAILRFRSSAVGDKLGIPFREVTMVKAALPWKNPVADILAYSEKIGGRVLTDRSISRRDIEVAKRWIAPPDLIERMARGIEVRLGEEYDFARDKPKVISTIPLPSLLLAVGYDREIGFSDRYRHGWVVSARVLDSDAFATLVIPNPSIPFYRASITVDELIVEAIAEPRRPEVVAEEAAELLGVRIDRGSTALKRQPYAKILPINDRERRRAIHDVSAKRGIAYSLGRFATWRPGLMTEDLIKDVNIINGWIRDGEGADYAMEVHEAEKKRTGLVS
jgi:hypothetical protein